MIFGFSGLGVVTALTYKNAPPIPVRVVDASGKQLLRGDDIEQGQEVSSPTA
jgi:nitric oxide reductase subunit B